MIDRWHRKFNGQTYTILRIYRTKHEAEDYARTWRKSHGKTKVVKASKSLAQVKFGQDTAWQVWAKD